MSKFKALVIDSCGIYCETAVRLMRDCASVKYCTFADEEMSGKIGVGMDGVERVGQPWAHVDDVDFIFCPDTNSGEIVEYLKKHGYPVAGAGAAEKIEVDRWWARNQVQAKNGLPVQETVRVRGTTALKDICKEPGKYFRGGTKEFFVKVDNEYRGILESFKHVDYKTSEPKINFIAYKTGPFQEKLEFICEEKLEGLEPGFDGLTFDGDILYPACAGYEIGKKSHIVRVYKNEEELPEPYWILHEGLKPEFKKMKTRFFYSNEFIIGKDKKPYLLDPTMRMASPGFTTQCELFENFTDVIFGLATGKPVKPVVKFKYGMTSIMFTMEAEKNFVDIKFPKEMRRWVKLIQGCKVGGDYYSIPPEPFVCTVVALGNTVKETLELCKERMKEVKFEGKNCDDSGLDKLMDMINEGKILGINF